MTNFTLILILITLTFQSISTVTDILPLTIYKREVPWRIAVKFCWDRLRVRLASNSFSIQHLQNVDEGLQDVSVWTGIFRRGLKDSKWRNQYGEKVVVKSLGLGWCENATTGNNCVVWKLNSGTPCLQAEMCTDKFAYGCEGLKIDFDSTMLKDHEAIFSAPWKISSGVATSNLESGPMVDHTLFTDEYQEVEEKVNFEQELEKSGSAHASTYYSKWSKSALPIIPYAHKKDHDYDYWASKKLASKDWPQYLWFQFKDPLVINGYSFVTKSNYVPNGNDEYQFFGSDCNGETITSSTYLHSTKEKKGNFKNFEKYQCYGFKMTNDRSADYAGIKYPIKHWRKKCNELREMKRENQISNETGEWIKCLPWGKIRSDSGLPPNITTKDAGNSCFEADPGDDPFCYCDEDKYGCTKQAITNTHGDKYDWCVPACNGKFVSVHGANKEIYLILSSSGKIEFSLFYHMKNNEETSGGDSLEIAGLLQTKENNWKEFKTNFTEKNKPVCIKAKSNKIRIALDDIQIRQIDGVTEDCAEGKFGSGCNQTCQCENGKGCNFFSGICHKDDCKWGFYGPDCQGEVTCDLPELVSNTDNEICKTNCSISRIFKSDEICKIGCAGEYKLSPGLLDTIKCHQVARNNENTIWKGWKNVTEKTCDGKKTGFCQDKNECQLNSEKCENNEEHSHTCHCNGTCDNACGDFNCKCGNESIGKICERGWPIVTIPAHLMPNVSCKAGESCHIPLPSESNWNDDAIEKMEFLAYPNSNESSKVEHYESSRAKRGSEECQARGEVIPLVILSKNDKLDKITLNNGEVITGICKRNKLKYEWSYHVKLNLIVKRYKKLIPWISLTIETPPTPPTPPTPIVSIVVGCIVPVVIIMLIVGILFLYRKRRKDEPHESPVLFQQTKTEQVNNAFEKDSNAQCTRSTGIVANENGSSACAYRPTIKSRTSRKNQKPQVGVVTPQPHGIPRGMRKGRLSEDSIPVENLLNLVLVQRQFIAEYEKEFETLPNKLMFSHDVASQPENKVKNRFQDIPAYDHSRVVLRQNEEQIYTNINSIDNGVYANLKVLEANPHSDYINANFVHGYEEQRFFIACQGPKKTTAIDFWEMIWQENVSKIVMLTNIVELGKKKCEQYWPNKVGQVLEYDDKRITLILEYCVADYTIRDFEVLGPKKRSGSLTEPQTQSKSRTIKQYHFTSWPDQNVPNSPIEMASFLQYVKLETPSSKNATETSPIVVHCSAGIGRTGTFISLWNLLNEATATNHVQVVETVKNLREFRYMMVQTVEQYKFIYDTLAVTIGTYHNLLKPIPVHEITSVCNDNLTSTFYNDLLSSLHVVSQVSPKVKEVSKSKANISKLRFPKGPFVCDDHLGHLLTGSSDGSSYFNGGFLDTYSKKNGFILTQAPLPNTINDFWAMVWDWHVETIVMLNEESKSSPIYWPTVKAEVTIGLMHIQVKEIKEVNSMLTIRTVQVYPKDETDREPLTLYQFQIKSWADNTTVPPQKELFFKFVEDLTLWQRQNGNPMLLAHCLNACDKSGLLLTLLNALERMDAEKMLHVPWAVLKTRETQSDVIVDKHQLQFCYTIAEMHQAGNETYANFQ